MGTAVRNLSYEIIKRARKPLHYDKITEEVLKKHQLRGKTPQYTVVSYIYNEPRLWRVSKGTYSLTEWVIPKLQIPSKMVGVNSRTVEEIRKSFDSHSEELHFLEITARVQRHLESNLDRPEKVIYYTLTKEPDFVESPIYHFSLK